MDKARQPLQRAALLALLVFLGAFAGAADFHTDDGCPVELHCLACRLTLGTVAVAPQPLIAVSAQLVDLGAAPPASVTPEMHSAPRAITTRGPPLA